MTIPKCMHRRDTSCWGMWQWGQPRAAGSGPSQVPGSKTSAGPAPCSSFSCTKSRSWGQSSPAGSRQEDHWQPGTEIFGDVGFWRAWAQRAGELAPSEAGKSCHCGDRCGPGGWLSHHVWCRGEWGSASWRCTVGWTHPMCLGMWDLSACLHPGAAFLATQQPNAMLVLIHGAKQTHGRVCFSCEPQLWHYVTAESSLAEASRSEVMVAHVQEQNCSWQLLKAQSFPETPWSRWD